MKLQSSFRRKIIYLVAIVGLLILLSFLGRPAGNRAGQAEQRSPGGLLAELRTEHGLDQAELGQLDPTSETIKLTTFGLRGVAANVLWGKAHRYKMKKDWTNLRATVNQITKLQPNFVSVWIFQAWNQSHNISVEFEDVRQRYRWVIKGIRFLQEGSKYNSRKPRLPWEAGWVLSHKIGRADEHKQFRKMFKEDDDFHKGRPVALRDNWLVGKEWFRRAEALADTVGGKMMGKGPLIYRSNAAMCQMSYAEALEIDGIFGEKARMAWKKAAEEWNEYGKVDIPTGQGTSIQLNAKERHDQIARDLVQQLEDLQRGLRQQLIEEKRAELTDEQRQALQIDPKERTAEQNRTAGDAERLIAVTDLEVARRITQPDLRKKALALAEQATRHAQIAKRIDSYRYQVNFDYWRLRAEMEQADETLAARELIYEGDKAFPGDLVTAKQKYDEGMAQWRKVLDNEEFRPMISDPTFGSEMMEVVDRYEQILDLRDEEFPEPFILQDIVDNYRQQNLQ